MVARVLWLPGQYQSHLLIQNSTTEELPVSSQAPEAPRSSSGSDVELQMSCLPYTNEKVTFNNTGYFHRKKFHRKTERKALFQGSTPHSSPRHTPPPSKGLPPKQKGPPSSFWEQNRAEPGGDLHQPTGAVLWHSMHRACIIAGGSARLHKLSGNKSVRDSGMSSYSSGLSRTPTGELSQSAVPRQCW